LIPKAKKSIENSKTFELVRLIPGENFDGNLKKFPITIPNNNPIKMLFKKGNKTLIVKAKAAIKIVKRIPENAVLKIILQL
jgi:hypothetical protein